MSDKAKSQQPPPEALIGSQLGDYTIQRLIGEGGMARVYEAYDLKLGRRAAIKVIEVKHGEDDETTQRFIREARAIASLDHPNIVSVYQFGETPNCYYLAMKLIDGRTLLGVMRSYRKQKKFMPPELIVQIMEQVAAAIDYAHSRSLIHRDIKPSNIMMTPNNQAILMDFGLTLNSSEDNSLGTAFGTPRYIAPEQAIASHRATAQSDIYSLGVVLYEMVTGQTPFDDESPMSLALAHISQIPPDPLTVRADIPLPVRTVVLKALEKHPDDRWPTATAMVEALRKAYQGIEPEVKLSSDPAKADTSVVAKTPKRETSKPGKTTSAKKTTVPPRPTLALGRTALEDPTMVDPNAANPRVQGKRRFSRLFSAIALIGLLAIGLAVVFRWTSTRTKNGGAIATAAPFATATIRIIYGDTTFVLVNLSTNTISLKGISFKRGDFAAFDASLFGDVTYTNFKAGACLMLRPPYVTDDVAPQLCSKSLQKSTGYNTPFWTLKDNDPIDTFAVLYTSDLGTAQTLKVCTVRVNTCEFALP